MKSKSRLATVLAIMISALVAPVMTSASTLDCQNVYVGRIWIEKGHGLYGVVLLNHPADTSGSYWLMFFDWTVDEKKAALAALTTAKISGHRVHVASTEADGCSIQTGQRIAKTIALANEP
jgi:hypothetical protein